MSPWDHGSSFGALLRGSPGSWLRALHGLCFMGCFPGVVTAISISTHGKPGVPGGDRQDHERMLQLHLEGFHHVRVVIVPPGVSGGLGGWT